MINTTENSSTYDFLITPDDEDLILKTLSKFDQLFEKEEYYNHQERLHRLNKALNSIHKSQNVSVSKFNLNNRKSNPNLEEKLKEKLEINLFKLNELLDCLLKEKEDHSLNNYESISTFDCLLTSSSEEDEKEKEKGDNNLSEGNEDDVNINMNMNVSRPKQSEKNKKRIMKNLYNYEIFLKSLFFEKYLKNENETPRGQNHGKVLEEFSRNLNFDINTTNFSTNNFNSNCCIYSSENMSMNNNTPITSKINSKDASPLNFNGSTPVIKKSFFEDKDIKNIIKRGARRGSMNDEVISKMGNSYLNHQRRRSDIVGIGIGSLSENFKRSSHYNNSAFGSKNVDGDAENILDTISDFNIEISKNLNLNKPPSIKNHQNSNISFNNPLEKRTSIFKDTSSLMNIIESEEFYSNFSKQREEDSNDEEEEDDNELSCNSADDNN
jgi:hypothetical protein